VLDSLTREMDRIKEAVTEEETERFNSINLESEAATPD